MRIEHEVVLDSPTYRFIQNRRLRLLLSHDFPTILHCAKAQVVL